MYNYAEIQYSSFWQKLSAASADQDMQPLHQLVFMLAFKP